MLAVYAWSLLSMLTTLLRTTLLSFRLQPTLTVLLAAAGAFGFVEAALAIAHRYSPPTSRRLVAAAGVLGAVGALAFSQDIPDVLKPDIVVAYTDTDGNGQRADRRPPGAEKYYAEIDAKIRDVTGKPRNESRRAHRRLQLPVVLPVLGLPGADVALRKPVGAVRQTGRCDRELGRPEDRRPVHRGAGRAAVGTAHGLLDAPRARTTRTRCGWPKTSTRTSRT